MEPVSAYHAAADQLRGIFQSDHAVHPGAAELHLGVCDHGRRAMKRTYIIGMKLYDDAFRFYKVGYACAESWILFLVILALTLLVFKSSDAWVYYADEGGSKK